MWGFGRDNLSYCGMVIHVWMTYARGYRKEESIIHLFVGSESFGGNWDFVLHWLSISTINLVDVLEYAVQFGVSNGFNKDNVGVQVVWLDTN